MKLCECGCGQPTKIATRTSKKYGHIQGQPVKFINHHFSKGSRSNFWKNGKIKDYQGYIRIKADCHPNADCRGYVREQILVAERVLGKFLPKDAVVHHTNGIKDDNNPCNLVICENDAYHHMLHRRLRAFKSCGHASWRKCCICKQWDDPNNLSSYKCKHYHKKCMADYSKEQYWKNKKEVDSL